MAEENGRLLAHLRVFDRLVRVGDVTLRIAGVGNVITAPDQRGRGHAGRLLEAMLAGILEEDFTYSLLRAYRAILYERYGWAPIEEELVRVTLPVVSTGPVAIEMFAEEDLPEVARFYDETNAARSGTTIRSLEYWRSQLEWLNEDRDGFLVARRGDGALAGYVRSRAEEEVVQILELGVRADDAQTGRALLSAAAARRDGRLQASLPPSLRALFRTDEGEMASELGFMGRVIDLPALAAVLKPLWLLRVRESDGRGGSFELATSAGSAEVRVSTEAVEILPREASETALDERTFAHLLFRGFDCAAVERVGAGQDLSLLRMLFPEQDFVVWRADAF